MRTMLLEITPARMLLSQALSRLTPNAVFWPTSPLRLTHLPDPPLPPGWVRVRNRLCGICGSDLHQLYLDVGLDVAPAALPTHRRIFLGHEMVGSVTEVGAGVAGWSVGDRVVRWGRMDDCRARGRGHSAPLRPRPPRVM